jgi:predicted GIY-YIG superfamily endonuclease
VDVARRLEDHNAGRSPHTARHRPWRLLVAVGFADAERAVRFGKFLKTDPGQAFARHHFR